LAKNARENVDDIEGRVYKVESSKADTLFGGGRVRRPNFVLDVKADKKVGN